VITGDDVKRARGRLHLTQTQLASMLGLSRRTIAEWEGTGELSPTIEGRLSGVFAIAGPSEPDVPPLASVSDLELVAEMARRLSSLRHQIPGGESRRTEEPPAQPDADTQTGHRNDHNELTSEYPADPAGEGVVGTAIDDASVDGAPRFTDRPGAC
jgi:hypothetical protein